MDTEKENVSVDQVPSVFVSTACTFHQYVSSSANPLNVAVVPLTSITCTFCVKAGSVAV